MRAALLQLPWFPGARARAEADRDARLRELVTGHFDFTWRSLVRLGVARADADDAAQQVFLVASRRLEDVEEGRERAFLFGACLRIAARHRRTVERRREAGDGVPETLPDPGLPPDEACDRLKARALLDRVLEALPLELRAVFVLYELEEQTMADIADTLAIPPGTVASRLRRARELFREQVAALAPTGGVP